MTNEYRSLGLAAGTAIAIGNEVIALAISPAQRGHLLRYWLDSEPDEGFIEDVVDNISYWSDFDIHLREEVIVGVPDLTEDNHTAVFMYCRNSAPSERFPRWMAEWFASDQSREALLLLTNRACLGRLDPATLDSLAVTWEGSALQLEARFINDSKSLRDGIDAAAFDLGSVVGRRVQTLYREAATSSRVPDSQVRMTTFLSNPRPTG